MTERPILFSTPMVQAIHDGRKTQTRRANKLHDLTIDEGSGYVFYSKGRLQFDIHRWKEQIIDYCPYGDIGDILWVRESFRIINHLGTGSPYWYKAGACSMDLQDSDIKWKPSIHMPKEAARIWLTIKSVRVERAQDISEADAIEEGIESDPIGDGVYKNYMFPEGQFRYLSAPDSFKSLWRSINGAESWNANPWVWVIEFERTSAPRSFSKNATA